MDKRRLRQIRGLARLRGIAEQRAAMDTSQAASALCEAARSLQQANDRVDDATRWKSEAGQQGTLHVTLYEQALLSELVLGAAVDAAEAARTAHKQAHEMSCEHLLEASRALNVAHRRRDRVELSLTTIEERRSSDDVADLWLSRRMHANR